MNELILPNGELTTNELEIMKELSRFYSDLYKNDAGFEENQQEPLDEILEHVEQSVSEEQLNKLCQQPTKDEIECITKILAKNKAPGSDGLTIEVIRACWNFMGDELLELILHSTSRKLKNCTLKCYKA
jgi:ATP phosphoribosyltransferase